MRRFVLLGALTLALTAPSAALAHSDFQSFSFSGSSGCDAGWSCSFIDTSQAPPGTAFLSCGQTVTLPAGGTRYVVNTNEAAGNPVHLGLGIFFDWHIHFGSTTDFVTGPETRQIDMEFAGPYPNTTVGTRRVSLDVTDPNPDWHFHAVKFVHQNGPADQPMVIRANC